MIYLSLNSDFMFLLDFVVAKFCRIFTCCFSVVMYHTCGQLCCVEHICDLNGTHKWIVQEKDLTEWKNYIQQEILKRTISDEHWTQMAMKNLRWSWKNVPSVKETSLQWPWNEQCFKRTVLVKRTVPQVTLGSDTWWGYICLDYTHYPQGSNALRVGHLRQCTPAHEQPWHSGSDSSGLVTGDVDSGLPV